MTDEERAGDGSSEEAPDSAAHDDQGTDEPSASAAFGAAIGQAARRAGLDPAQEETTGRVVWKAIGGVRGVVESILPLVLFLASLTIWTDDLIRAVVLSVGAAAAFTVLRLLQRQAPSAALGGLIAVGVAGALVLITGRAEDNFIPGFITNVAYGSAFAISAFAGWSIIGLAAGFLMDEGTAWRRDKRKRRVFFWLALMWAGLFFLRLAVQFPMWLASVDVQTIGTVKLVMGLPLFAPLVAITWLVARSLYPAARKSSRSDVNAPDAPDEAPDGTGRA